MRGLSTARLKIGFRNLSPFPTFQMASMAMFFHHSTQKNSTSTGTRTLLRILINPFNKRRNRRGFLQEQCLAVNSTTGQKVDILINNKLEKVIRVRGCSLTILKKSKRKSPQILEHIVFRRQQLEDRKEANRINQECPEFLKDIIPFGLSFFQHDKLAVPIEPVKKVIKEEDNEPEVEGCEFGVECNLELMYGPAKLAREYQQRPHRTFSHFKRNKMASDPLLCRSFL